ncbi:leucyl/phenylalanyl-tRNA--protein transferase [Plesiomonas shigelloides]|uniref:leucyl/phenylalanyl-tRNA--protein transferase n=1 Tax=Plesiomonas shigelloides TaxID=703 RepID=UPI002FC820A0
MWLHALSADNTDFPPIDSALTDPNGLLAFGGDLSVERLLNAYRHGIFPWFNPGEPILWWSPDPRAVFFPAQLQPNRSMRKWLKKSPFRVTVNRAFGDVIHHCADVRSGETWISEQIQAAYVRLHHLGIAHSIEVWQGDTLVGGLYGVAIGLVFCGESMFSLQDNASKTALLTFNQAFYQAGGTLIDCQVMNPHLASLGAVSLPRSDFQRILVEHQTQSLPASFWQPRELAYRFESLNGKPPMSSDDVQSRTPD